MNEEKIKVIFVSEKTDVKIPDQLRAKLDEMGVEVEIAQKATIEREPTEEELIEMMTDVLREPTEEELIEMMKDALREPVLPEGYIKQQDENFVPKKYVPKKIGKISKAKVKDIRGKRYGR